MAKQGTQDLEEVLSERLQQLPQPLSCLGSVESSPSEHQQEEDVFGLDNEQQQARQDGRETSDHQPSLVSTSITDLSLFSMLCYPGNYLQVQLFIRDMLHGKWPLRPKQSSRSLATAEVLSRMMIQHCSLLPPSLCARWKPEQKIVPQPLCS